MLRRNLRHALRYPSMPLSTIGMPVVVLLQFDYAFGGALGAGIGTIGGRRDYVDYVVPGVLLMAATSGAVATAVSVCVDMTEGIMGRFRTMAISRTSVLHRPRHREHVADDGQHRGGRRHRDRHRVSARMPARSAGSERQDCWPSLTFALTWLSAGFGLTAKTVESASNAPLPLLFLPFLGPPSCRRTRCRRPAGVRRAPAVHPDHRDAARAAARDRGEAVAVAVAVHCIPYHGRRVHPGAVRRLEPRS